MQKGGSKNQKSRYTQSGVPAHRTPGGKRRSNAPKIILRVLQVAAVVTVLILAIVFVPRLFSQSGDPKRLNAHPTDNIQAFGEDVLIYDGVVLSCIGTNGTAKWQVNIGTDGDYYTKGSMIVAWSGTRLQVINKNGQFTFNDHMDGTVLFARVGDGGVAVCMGDELNSVVRVMTHTGTVLETINTFEDLYVLDIGFFTASGNLMWVLTLDINGNSPISKLATYDPGKMSTGAVELQDELVYGIYVHNSNLMVVDTTRIRTYNYKCVEQTDISSILVYGWQVRQDRAIGRNTYVLLEQLPGSTSSDTFTEVRLITNYDTQSYRTPVACFASGISDKGVYAFDRQVVYFAPFGSKAFTKSMPIPYPVTDFVCMLEKSRAVIVSGSDVYMITLPE